MNSIEIDSLYSKYDSKFNSKFNDQFSSLVNFSKHKSLPFQRWHYYQEGYSPELVDLIIKYLKINPVTSKILDPFVGSGSTLVSAQKNGIEATGVELNPFSYFMSCAKTKNYNKKSIEICKQYKIPKYKKIANVFDKYQLSIIRKLYSEKSLTKIELIKESINQINNIDSQTILKSSLLSILEPCSNYKKGGNGLKKRKKENYLDVYEEFNKKLSQIIDDIESKSSTSNITLYNENITNLDKLVKDNSIDLSIFSPPYVNCFDYFEVYKIELWLGEFIQTYDCIRKLRKSALTSNLNANLKKDTPSICLQSYILEKIIDLINVDDLWDKRIPKMILLYFSDMKRVLEDLFKKQKTKGYIAIVVGNSAYSGIPVPTDLILCEIASNLGFEVKEIIIARNNETSSQQYKKIGNMVKYIRESIIILQK